MQEFLKQVYQYPGLNENNLQQIIDAHTEIAISKNDFLIKETQVSNAYYILYSGYLRSFVIDHLGNEVTTNFFSPGSVVIEVASIFNQVPTQENFQALTPCVLFEIKLNDFQNLFSHIPVFAEWGRAWMTAALTIQKERMLNMLTKSALQRYLDLLRQNSEIFQIAPLKQIATYLGITDTSLSRIRKEVSIK